MNCEKCGNSPAKTEYIEHRVGSEKIDYPIGIICTDCKLDCLSQLIRARDKYIHKAMVSKSRELFEPFIKNFMDSRVMLNEIS